MSNLAFLAGSPSALVAPAPNRLDENPRRGEEVKGANLTAGTMATAAASATVAAGLLARAKRSKVGRRSQVLHGIKFPYALQKDAYADLEFLNDVGYLPDGTPMNRAGNAINHPETIGPDPHTPGSPLPRANFTNSVGYLPDGTPMNAAGNALNHPENMAPDMHTPGSPLPASFLYANVGYLVDGTDMAVAGNLSVQGGATPASSPGAIHIDVGDGGTITQQEVLAAQQGWADAIKGISKTCLSGGDYVAHAAQAAGELYGYGHTNVLFKPTKAKDVPFRPDANGAMSYFVGADAVTGGIPEDHGFAINGGKGWSEVRFDNHQIDLNGSVAIAMGTYYFTSAEDGSVSKVEYTFGYKKNADGKVRIFLHHSSVPYGYGAAPAITQQEVLAAQQGWADAIKGISKTYLSGGDYVAHAGQAAGELYGYGHTNVLFKPTKAKDVPFRPDANGAMSYFVGAEAVSNGIAEDHGFAINGGKGWSQVVFDNHQIDLNGSVAIAMGTYYFTSADDGSESKVEYTFGYKKNADGKVRIFLHHSSLPYGYGAPSTPTTQAAAAAAAPAASFTPATAAVGGDVLHGIKFPYAIQKDAHVDLAFLNDVGYLPDGTPMNRAGNAINHPETIGPDPHTPGSPLPRALFCNSVGYLPDGTPMNAAGNAMNHPETMQPDMHTPGSPLPKSVYYADVGYLVDGTDMAVAGNLSVQGQSVATKAAQAVAAAVATGMPSVPQPVSETAPVAAAFVGTSAQTRETIRHNIGFAYSVQKDAYVDLTYGNDVGYLPDGTPMNRAGNCINHPETIGPDPHAPGSPLPRALFVNDVGYLPDGTPMNRAGNAINHPETIGPDLHAPGSALPTSAYAADVGYLVDGTPLDAAGNNAIH